MALKRAPRTRTRATLPALSAALLAVALSPALAHAAPGDFDTTFAGGKQFLDFGGNTRATHIAVTPDGHIVAIGATDSIGAGDFAVARVGADGNPDQGFGSGGTVTVGTNAGVNDLGGGIAVLPDERIVVAGQGGTNQDFITRRLNVDGTVDGSYAGGDLDFGGAETVSAMTRQSDGKLVIVGSTNSVGGGDFAIARLNADGTPDNTFSGDGKQTVDFGGADAANAVALAPDGKIVVAGQGGAGNDMAVTRLDTDGTVDTSFSPALLGKANVDFGGTDVANGVAVQPDGKVVLDGTTNATGSGDVAVARLSSDGALDASFSGDGELTLDYGAANEQGLALALQQNGRIVIYGQGGSFNDFQLTRVNPDGSIDASFGVSGTADVDFGGNEFDGDVAVQPDGNIVTVGTTDVTVRTEMVFSRLLGDPPTTTPPPAPPSPTFTVTLKGGSKQVIAVRPGHSATRTITVSRNTTSVGPIALTARKLPAGLTVSISPKFMNTGDRTSTLRITAPANAKPRYIKTGLITATPEATAGAGVKKVTFGALVQSQLVVFIDGLEITQGVQTDEQPRRFNYDGVRLMRGKKTIVRAFADLEGIRPARVPRSKYPPLTVALYGYDKNQHPLPGSPLLPDWSPSPSTLRLNQAGLPAATREASNTAHVFVLPENWTRGTIGRLLAKPVAPQPSTSSRKRPEPISATYCTQPSCGAVNAFLLNTPFFLPPRPRVLSLVKVRYFLNGKYTGDVVPAARAFDKFVAMSPIPFVFLNGAGQRGPYPDYSGMTSTSDGILEKTQAWDDANHHPGDLVMGVFAYPAGGGYAPGPRAGVADAADSGNGQPGRPVTVDAHEFMHLLGRGHADTACGGSTRGTGFPDANGRMRSVGIDTTEGSGNSSPGAPPYRVIPDDPATGNPGFDLMSYCNIQTNDPQHWISARTWSGLLGVPTPEGRRSLAAVPTGSFLVLRARDTGGQVQIHTVTPSTLGAAPSAASPYRLVARNAGGAVVTDAPISASVAEQAAPAIAPSFTSLEGRVPAAGVARLEVVRNGTVVASIARSAHTPTARLLSPGSKARLHGEKPITVRWRVADADGDRPSTALEFSANGGKSYRTVATGEGTGQITLLRRMLATAAHGRLRLRATDGFNTTVTPARPVVVLARKPVVTIIDPMPRQRIQGGAALYMHGAATDDLGRNLTGKRLRWYAGRKFLGSGAILSAVLPAGTRSIRLVARARSGRAGSATAGLRMRATTPFFLRLTHAKRISRKAKTVTLTVASTQSATLKLGKQHHAVGRKARRVRFKIKKGKSTLRLHFVLKAGSRSSSQYVLVPRKQLATLPDPGSAAWRQRIRSSRLA